MGRRESSFIDSYKPTPEGEELGNKWVRWSLTVSAIIGLIVFVGVVIAFLLGWNP